MISGKKTERSFTLLETIIALGILAATILQLIGSQGKVVHFSDYSRRVSEATWLAKRIMSQVEYNWSHYDFKDLEIRERDVRFEDMPDSDYTYSLEIKEWKFPILDFLASGGPSDEEDDSSAKMDDGSGDMIKNMLSQVLGDEILKIAHVEVFWPEGAKRNSTTLTYLLTNQRKIDEEMQKLKPTYEKVLDIQRNEGGNRGKDPATEAECKAAGRNWDRAKKVCLPGRGSGGGDPNRRQPNPNPQPNPPN